MMLRGVAHVIWIAVSFFLVDSLRGNQAKESWLRGSGKNLEICLKGEVFDSDDQPATAVEVTSNLNARGGKQILEPTFKGNWFEIWIPVNQLNWYSMWLRATSTLSGHVAYKKLNAYELRQAAIDGLTLTLQSSTRQVLVKVIHDGQPVSDAQVKAELGFGIELRSRTNTDGIARFGLLQRRKLSRITVWTDEFLLGGYSFDRKPTRDPSVDEHVVELVKCRDQKLRFVDEDGLPVPDIRFVIQMATPPPNYNYLGTDEHSRLSTDAAGEVMYRWFPEWDKHHYYAELYDDQWVLDGEKEIVDDTVIFKVKKKRTRKQISGRVVSANTDVGGFCVYLRSFQGERKNSSDVVRVFTNSDGSFSVEVLPDATYCGYALDSRWVGKMIDLIPYQTFPEKVTPPELTVLEGQEVEVIATFGPQKTPYSNLSIHFRREHQYTWREDGRTRHGTGGPQWWATTDDSGRATTRTLPGKLNVSVYTPIWRTKEEMSVSSDEDVIVRLHRELEEKQTVTCQLVLADGLESDLDDAEIKVGSVDGNYSYEQTLSCGSDGQFSFETVATETGIFASTKDGLAAGWTVTNDLDTPIKLQLRPTVDYQGQILGEGDQPLVGHDVFALARVEGDEDYNGMFVKSFEAKRIEAKTDSKGNFTLAGVPSEMKIFVYAKALDGSDDNAGLEEIYLIPGDSRPRTVSRMAKTSQDVKEEQLAERYAKKLRDSSLMGYHLMLITSGNSNGITRFVDENFIDRDAHKDISSYLQIALFQTPETLDAADAAFLQEHGWKLAEGSLVFAYAINAEGKEMGRLEIDVTDEGAADEVADFLQRHAPLPINAEKKWQQAFTEAKQTNRRVWARISQRYCGPCFMLARWLGDQEELLEKDYVMLKIDDFRDENGAEVAKRLTHGKHHGVPFHAIFDQDEQMLIDSAGPLGNIGHPSGLEGNGHLRRMLLETRQNLTDVDIDQLIESLED